ncbi:MAG: hypothetical protein A2Z32_10675 [Chloroflexi bacterium RBG_16_69_14]|nr:MAG: hypothetical protein A2Z32_10675 [Chloroflexi bacterium RBG_16_69_14]
MTANEPERLFRATTPDEDGGPRLDASARTLGARPLIDVRATLPIPSTLARAACQSALGLRNTYLSIVALPDFGDGPVKTPSTRVSVPM